MLLILAEQVTCLLRAVRDSLLDVRAVTVWGPSFRKRQKI